MNPHTYTQDEVYDFTTRELKLKCIEKCKAKGIKSSWVQSCSNGDRMNYLISGVTPDESKTTPPASPPAAHPASTSPNKTPSAIQNGSIEDMIVQHLENKLENKVQTCMEIMKDQVEAELEQAQDSLRPQSIEIKGKPTINLEDDEIRHPAFEDVFEALFYKQNVCLVGHAGTGKSTLVKQVWDVLADTEDLQASTTFQYIGCSAGLSEAQLLGKMDAHGKYHTGLAVDKFENGGLNLWDEADAMDGNAGLIRNAMLDGQGYIAVPNRTENPIAWKHDKYYDASCMNTFGDGQDFTYSGRGQQDSATLDRLGDTTIFVDYDKGLELALIGEEDKKWADMLWELRENAQKEHLHERIISTRRFADAQIWAKAGKSRRWYLDRITVAWTDEEKDKVALNSLKQSYGG